MLGVLIVRGHVADERALDISPAKARFLWRASERDRAGAELLRLQTLYAAAAPCGLVDGHKIFRQHEHALRAAAGLRAPVRREPPPEMCWPPPRKPSDR